MTLAHGAWHNYSKTTNGSANRIQYLQALLYITAKRIHYAGKNKLTYMY